MDPTKLTKRQINALGQMAPLTTKQKENMAPKPNWLLNYNDFIGKKGGLPIQKTKRRRRNNNSVLSNLNSNNENVGRLGNLYGHNLNNSFVEENNSTEVPSWKGGPLEPLFNLSKSNVPVVNLSHMTGAKPETVAKAMNVGSARSNAALVAAAAVPRPNKKRTRNVQNNLNKTIKGAGGAAAKPTRKAVPRKPVAVAAMAPIAAAGAGGALSEEDQKKADNIIAAITADVSSPFAIGSAWATQKRNFAGSTIGDPFRKYVLTGLETIANGTTGLSQTVLLGIVNELTKKPKII
jgi:hypothetical protein